MCGMVSYLDLDDGIHESIVNDREGLRGSMTLDLGWET